MRENPCTILTNSITDKANKCVYDVKNGLCLDLPKNCSELGTFPNGVESDKKESICKRVEVRETDKKCVVKQNGAGCELVDNSQNPEQSSKTNTITQNPVQSSQTNPNPQNPSQSGQTNPSTSNPNQSGKTGASVASSSPKDNSENDKPNSARGQYLNKIVIFILFLLF